MTEREVVILGGGLAGMAAAMPLGDRAVVLERAERPGGLVKSVQIGDYWFDHVIHLLYFRDPAVAARITPLLGDDLAPCPPDAWVVTAQGTARFPLQLHLGHLGPETAARCIESMAAAHAAPAPPANYDELLRTSFGGELYDLFFRPYNDKMWKRPLHELAPAGFQWNLHLPDLDQARAGAERPDRNAGSYNANGFYPRPPPDSPVRGMECLSVAVSKEVRDLRVHHEVTAIHPATRTVTVQTPDGSETVRWSRRCVSTLPMPTTLALCAGAPPDLVRRVGALRRNAVVTVALRIQGPRPDAGTWRYYADPELAFTRLVFLHAFDPALAPPEGWPLLAEVPWPAEQPLDHDELVRKVTADVWRSGELPEGSVVLGADVFWIDPAYVCFDLGTETVIDEARAWLRGQGIEPLGRYGRWEYSSMAGALGDGLAVGDALAAEAAA